jgi:hypothetical protein
MDNEYLVYNKLKIGIVFINDNGKYYIEQVELTDDTNVLLEKWRKTHRVVFINETLMHGNFRYTQTELSKPTTRNNEVLIIIQDLKGDMNILEKFITDYQDFND